VNAIPSGTSYRAYAPPVSDTLGERIKSLRISRGLTGAQLAARIGIGENAVFKLESGTSAEPKFHVGIKLARALGVTPETLAFGEIRGAFGESTPPADDLLGRLERVERILEESLLVNAASQDAVAQALEQDHATEQPQPGTKSQPKSSDQKGG